MYEVVDKIVNWVVREKKNFKEKKSKRINSEIEPEIPLKHFWFNFEMVRFGHKEKAQKRYFLVVIFGKSLVYLKAVLKVSI